MARFFGGHKMGPIFWGESNYLQNIWVLLRDFSPKTIHCLGWKYNDLPYKRYP